MSVGLETTTMSGQWTGVMFKRAMREGLEEIAQNGERKEAIK